MKRRHFFGGVLTLVSLVTPLFGQSDELSWVRVTAKAAWAPRDSCGEVVFCNRLWLLGGWFQSFEDPPRDVWSSADGAVWTRATNAVPFRHSDLPTTLAFKDRMWIMGGWHGGRLQHASASNEVWSSADGVTWKQETKAAGWSPRLGAAGVVFRDRMWVLGGCQQYYFGDDNDRKSDVWSSADGVTWQQETARAPWPPRAYHAAVVHDDAIWVFGGGNYLPRYEARNDVWRSADGVHWTKVTDQAPWPPRIWFSAAVYRDRVWVLGGWSNQPSKNWNDVWHSADGRPGRNSKRGPSGPAGTNIPRTCSRTNFGSRAACARRCRTTSGTSPSPRTGLTAPGRPRDIAAAPLAAFHVFPVIYTNRRVR